jgi:hypothetical protein
MTKLMDRKRPNKSAFCFRPRKKKSESSLRRGEGESEKFAQLDREVGRQRFIDEADGNEIAQVEAVFVAEGGEYHAVEGREQDETEFSGVLAFLKTDVGLGLL